MTEPVAYLPAALRYVRDTLVPARVKTTSPWIKASLMFREAVRRCLSVRTGAEVERGSPEVRDWLF